MSTIAIDTLRLADGLKAVGTPAPQAEATARVLGEALADAIAPHEAARERLEGTVTQLVEWRCEWRHEWRCEVSTLHGGQQQTTKRLDTFELRLDKVEQRLDKVEQRLDKVEQALRAVELRLYGQSRDLGWLKVGHALVLASVLSLLAKAFA